MTTKHKNIPFVFDHENFAKAMDTVMTIDDITDEDLAGYIGLDHSTVNNYRHNRSSSWHPLMKNFLAICNALDLDPRNYFELDPERR